MIEEINEGPNQEITHLTFQTVGSFCLKDELDPDFQQQLGLVSVVIENEQLCPMEQFTYDEQGFAVLRPELSNAWETSRAFDEQLGIDAVATLARFDTPRPQLNGKTWWQILTGDEMDAYGPLVLRDILEDAQHRFSRKDEGVIIRDPRTI